MKFNLNMKKLLSLLILCSSFTFGQYVKDAVFKLKKDGKIIKAKDVIFQKDGYDYKEFNDPFVNLYLLKSDADISFDSVNYSTSVPELKQTFFKNSFPEGVYETIDDFNKKQPTSTERIEAKEDGEGVYNNPKDLMLFKYIDKKQLVKTPFAVVYNGDVYFNLKSINKLESKDMKVTIPVIMNRFIRIRYEDDNYFYSEFYPKKREAGSNVLMYGGGALGALIATSAMSKTKPGKSIPFILLKGEDKFYQLDNCLNFNEFLGGKIHSKIECNGKNELNLKTIRNILIKE